MPSISARRFVATMNNPVRDDIPYDWFENGDVVYVAWQKEVGAITGTPHLQIYFIVKENERNKNGHTVKWVSENLSNKMDIRIAKGDHEQCNDYVTKEDTRVDGPWILGAWEGTQAGGGAKKGRDSMKKTADEVRQKIIDGVSDAELWQDHFAYMTVHHKAMNTFRLTLASQERTWPTKLLVLTGPPGTGKSRKALELARRWGGAFWLRKPRFGGSVWFDGYDPMTMPVLVLDEFDGSWMSFEEFLRICDRYPLQVEGKGTMKPFLFKYIIVTSNKLPREWWSEEAVPMERYKALLRRMGGKLGAIRHMTTIIDETDGGDDNRDFTEIVDQEEADAARELRELCDPPQFHEPLKSSYEEVDDAFDDEAEEDEIFDDEVDVDGLDDQFDDIEYEEGDTLSNQELHHINNMLIPERYGGETQPLGSSGHKKLSGGVIDLDSIDDVEPSQKRLKRSTPMFGIERVDDSRIGSQPVQSRIKITMPSKEHSYVSKFGPNEGASALRKASRTNRRLNMDDDNDFDDK